MSQPVGRHGSLEIEEDLAAQHREWRFQAVGLVLLGLLVIGALSGLFGHGPLAATGATSPSGELQVDSGRFARRGGDESLRIRADAALASAGRFEVAIERGFVDDLGIEHVEPSPESVETRGDALVYVFPQAEPAADLEVTLQLSPAGMWSTGGVVSVGGQSVRVRQFVYP